jgi:hypothetical protein
VRDDLVRHAARLSTGPTTWLLLLLLAGVLGTFLFIVATSITL